MEVRFYPTAAGRSPVERFIDDLDHREAGRVTAALADLAAHGFDGSHAYKKQEQKAPRREIETALERLAEAERAEGWRWRARATRTSADP